MTLGLIVNPIAGMGGRVGLKGTDGSDALAVALERGANPIAPDRADRALARLSGSSGQFALLAGRGALGEDLARARSIRALPVGEHAEERTTSADTREVAAEMLERDVDLIMFAGGDGTARDVYDSVGASVAVIGIPTGVKMYSGVFASGPEAAGDTAAAFLSSVSHRAVRRGEVADADEQAIREGRVATRLYGYLQVPVERSHMLAAKSSGSPAAEPRIDALAARTAAQLDPDALYILGPGTTTGRILDHLGLPATLLGVDVVHAGELVGSDLDEAGLLRLLLPGKSRIITGVIGGQGFLFGRGNQQISAEVIRRVGVENITILADAEKLHGLSPPWLRVDTGDPEVDAMLCGYREVHIAPGRSTVMRITT
jgi:predicted polyphosphate/ATP-dependent NAD kinase